MERPLRTLLFDLDGCLYPASNGYEKQIRQNLFKWMNERLGVPLEEAPDLWRKHFRVTNQTLKALHQAGFQFDLDDYFLSTRAGSEQYLQPDPEVRAFLQELPQDKWVFTNADEQSARTALKLLGIDDCFKGVYGARFMGPGTCCKPDQEAFEKVLHAIGADATTTAFFEDSTRNLRAAKRLGLTTILVQGPTMHEENLDEEELSSFVDVVIPAPYSVHLRQALPRLFET